MKIKDLYDILKVVSYTFLIYKGDLMKNVKSIFLRSLSIFICAVILWGCSALSSVAVFIGSAEQYPSIPVTFNVIEAGSLKTDMVYYSELPSYYSSKDLGYVTEPKNQGLYGTCWAFSTVSVAESSILRHGGTVNGEKVTKDTIDLSEAQVAYFTYHDGTDPLGTLRGDSVTYLGENWLEEGGNEIFATFTLMGWKGIANDSVMPYDKASPSSAYDASLAGEAAVRMENAYWFNMSDVALAKKMVMEHGAVFTDYMHHDSFLNTSNGAYYCPDRYSANHAITVIGWDDSYSRNNFLSAPPADGAWLVKNSWGTSWGDGGYGWISYYDGCLSVEDSAAYVFADALKTDNNYQYDGSLGTSYVGLPNCAFIANDYTASASKDGYERIDSVSVAFYSPSVEYSIQIYKNADDLKLLNGEPLLSKPVTGVTTTAGYHTIPIDEEIIVKSGDNFTVVVQFSSTTDEYVFILTDSQTNVGHDLMITSDVKDDRSYYGQEYDVSPTGIYLDDIVMSDGTKHTARLKAQTSNVAKIDYTLEGLDTDGAGYVDINEDAEITLVAENGRKLPKSIKVKINGEYTDGFSYDRNSGTVKVFDISGDVEIIATAIKAEKHFIHFDDGDFEYEVGEKVSIKAPHEKEINHHKYRFHHWKCDVFDVDLDLTSEILEFEMPEYDITFESQYVMVGDLNADEHITAIDVYYLMLSLKGVGDSGNTNDINDDGKVTALDRLELLNILKGC